MDFLKRFPGFVLTSRLTTYFYPVTRNFAFAVARKRKRTNLVAMDGDTSLPALALPTNESDESERHRHLRNALARLPATHAEVLLMAVVDELTMEEIGVALGIPTGTVKSRLYHALGKLRKDEQCVRYFETIEVNG
jgi:RNA polymerase sigma-70 factor (ECF subfamily)